MRFLFGNVQRKEKPQRQNLKLDKLDTNFQILTAKNQQSDLKKYTNEIVLFKILQSNFKWKIIEII
jgi:hypothetical protein